MKSNSPLDQLDKERQLSAAYAVMEKAAALFAGAGTGKTKTLIGAIYYLLTEQHVDPEQILALTFSRKAIREVRKRLGTFEHANARDVTVNTFHAFAAAVLDEHGKLLGFGQNYTIISEANEQDMLKRIMETLGYNADGKKPETIHKKIERYKNRGIAPNQITPDTETKAKLANIYAMFQTELKTEQLVTYSDLILHATTLLREHETVRVQYTGRYRNILVDEFQDINPAQYALLRLLIGIHTSIWIVGDDDQVIYTWRGADAAIMQRFISDYAVTTPRVLEHNYRSTGYIVEAAKGLIEHNNPNRQDKNTHTTNARGKRLKVYLLADVNEEAEYIVKRITHLINEEKIKAGRIAVLVRLKQHYEPVRKLLAEKGIDCHLSANKHITEIKGVRIALAYLRAVTNPKDSQSILAILNTPKRGIGKKTVRKIEAYAAQRKMPLWEAVIQIHKMGKADKASPFIAGYSNWRKMIKIHVHAPRQAASQILHTSGYINSLKLDKQADIEQMLEMMDGYDSIPAFLKSIMQEAYESDAANRKAVNLLTIHAAKSMEFHTVFLPGWEDGVFPDYRALRAGKEKKLAEERRLAYVGITRAEKRVYITHIVKKRRGYGDNIIEVEPSRFITELPVHTRIRKRSKQASQALLSLGADERKSRKIRKNGVVSHNGDYGFGRVIRIEGDLVTVRFNDMHKKKIIHKKDLTKA